MCLTEEALFRRKWGRYAAMARVFAQHPVPSRYFGASTASDNVFDWLHRLAEISMIVREHADAIQSVTDPDVAARLRVDFEGFEDELRAACRLFAEHADSFHELQHMATKRASQLDREIEAQRTNRSDRT